MGDKLSCDPRGLVVIVQPTTSPRGSQDNLSPMSPVLRHTESKVSVTSGDMGDKLSCDPRGLVVGCTITIILKPASSLRTSTPTLSPSTPSKCLFR
jgi:hypothetical protein